MNIKAGQWVRTNENDFFEMVLYLGTLHAHNDKYVTSIPIGALDIIKVANTPQELIEVGDLVSLSKLYWSVGEPKLLEVDKLLLDVIGIKLSIVTKILTPNSNGGYDLQWEAE